MNRYSISINKKEKINGSYSFIDGEKDEAVDKS